MRIPDFGSWFPFSCMIIFVSIFFFFLLRSGSQSIVARFLNGYLTVSCSHDITDDLTINLKPTTWAHLQNFNLWNFRIEDSSTWVQRRWHILIGESTFTSWNIFFLAAEFDVVITKITQAVMSRREKITEEIIIFTLFFGLLKLH